MRSPRTSIATMLIAIIVITVSIVLGVVGSIAYRYYSEYKWAGFHDALALEADQFATSLAPAAWNLEYPQVSKLMESQMQDPRYAGIFIDLETKRFILIRDSQGALQSQETALVTDDLILTQRKVVFSDQKIGEVKMYATPRYIQEELLGALILLVILAILLHIILTLALYFSLQRLVLQPLRMVERYANEVANGELAPTSLGSLRFLGELEGLTRSIDAMVRQLATRNTDLQQSTERFQSVIRLLPIPLSMYDELGHTLFLNERFTATFGYSLADIPHIDDWFAKAYPDTGYRQDVIANWEREAKQAQRLGVPVKSLAYEVICRDGTLKHVEIGGILSANVNIAVLNDITDRTLAERELARHREHLEELVTIRTAELAKTYQRLEETQFAMDHAGIGIVWIDADSGQFLYVNDQACELSGHSCNELLSMQVIEVASELTLERLRQLTGNLHPKGFVRIETDIARNDGILMPVETSLYFKPPSPERPGHYIAFLTDITQRKKAESALIGAKQAAETAAQARSEFLANMSHEIRTPMNAIIGMSQLALQTDLDKKQRNYIEKAHLSAGSLLGILNDILDFSKVEAGRLDIESLEFPIERIFDNLANLVALKAEEKGLELVFSIAPETPAQLIGDPMRLGQILTNLVGNAIKFTEKGAVVISCTAENTAKQSYLKFAVRDSGIGMSEKQIATLFTPFQQGDNSISRRYGGTGLGLAISKRLAELLGGKISIESQLGHGSTFTFSAPFAIPTSSQGVRRKLPEILRGENVLVVDDNPESLEILCGLMSRFGMNVDHSSSAQEALTLLQGPVHYRLLLCDWKMPGMDGIEMVQAMTVTPSIKMPSIIIMVSAYGVEELRHKSANLPLAGILCKPVSPSSLLDTLLCATGLTPLTALGTELPGRRPRLARTLLGTQVLLVEDNAINQELALEFLQDEGAEVQVANNGQEALDKLAGNLFDCVLMDVQMPVMDGLAATRAIRAQERFRDLPIIAMTAGALASERDQTRLAGMNDHVTKPINVDELFSVMLHHMKLPAIEISNTEKSPSPLPEQHAGYQVLDVKQGLSTLNGNYKGYQRILKIFLDSGDNTLGNLQTATASGDLTTIRGIAHSLKGSAGNIGALALQEIARRLDESARRTDDINTLNAQLDELQQTLRLTQDAGNAFLASVAGNPWGSTTASHDQDDLVKALERLRTQLLADDTDALDTLESILEGKIPESLDAELNNLARYVTKYQFKEALDNLNRVLASRQQALLMIDKKERNHGTGKS